MKVLLVGNYEYDRQQSMQRFVSALASGLVGAGCEVEVIRPEPWLGRWKPAANGLGKWLGYVDKFLLFPWKLARQAGKVDLVHVCDHSNAMYVPFIQGRRHLITCHDLLAVRSALGEFAENRTGRTGRLFQWLISRGLRAARAIAFVSQATEADWSRLSPGSVPLTRVIHNGLNYDYLPIPSRDCDPTLAALFQRHASTIPHRYFLHVGGDQWYKNRHRMLRAFGEFQRMRPASCSLVMVGAELEDPAVDGRCDRSQVFAIRGASSLELNALYSRAEALVFPSLAEGFGWPVIEAQAAGCRVLAADIPVLREVGGLSCVFVDPRDEGALAAAMADLMDETDAQRNTRTAEGERNAARFSLEAMCLQYKSFYQEILTPSPVPLE